MPTIDVAELESFIARVATAIGTPDDIAEQLAESLVTANLRGHDSHGVRRLPMYYAWSRDGTVETFPIEPDARPIVSEENATTGLVDGRNAFGQAAGRVATDLLVEKTADTGVGVVGIRDATHLGRIGEWAERVADAGFCFGAFVNTQGGALVAPAGSAQRRYTTNPVAFGMPTFDALAYPIVLDIATSQVAHGKIRERTATDEPVSEAWTIAEDGSAITDAEAYVDGAGAILPLGGRAAGYKGFGLAMIAELFAATAGDALTVPEADGGIYGNAAMFFGFDPTTLTTREAIERRVSALERYIRETEYSDAISPGDAAYGDRARLPGEPEYLITEERRSTGIPIPDADAATLVELAREVGVEEIPTVLDV